MKNQNNIENVVIIGAGPAGLAAGIYAGRACLNPLILAGSPPRSQIAYTMELENYPGLGKMSGVELIEKMKTQAIGFGARIVNEEVKKIEFGERPFIISQQLVTVSQELVKTSSTSSRPIQPILTKSIIIATGAKAKWLGLESEKRFIGKGVSACATCDGFFYRGKTVAVVGGGDTALDDALFLTKFANKVYIIHRRDQFRGSKITQEKVFNNQKIEVIWNTVVEKVLGSEKVDGIQLKSVKAGQELVKTNSTNLTSSTIQIDGLFVAIGIEPETKVFADGLMLDNDGYIVTSRRLAIEINNCHSSESWNPSNRFRVKPGMTTFSDLDIRDFDFSYDHITSVEGVFAAGDCADPQYRQVATAVGTGVAAALEAQRWLEKQFGKI